MTKEYLCTRIEELEDAAEDSCCFYNADSDYFEGFAAACDEIRQIIREEWQDDK